MRMGCTIGLRSKLREHFWIAGSDLDDCLAEFCFERCVRCQLSSKLEHQRHQKKLLTTFNLPLFENFPGNGEKIVDLIHI